MSSEKLPATTKNNVPAPATPMALIQSAVQSGLDINQLQLLINLHEQYERREAEKAFWKAFASFKSVNIEIPKNGKAGFTTKNGGWKEYEYDLLSDFTSVVTPKLAENGLSLSWRVVTESNKISVTAILSHELGHSESMTISAAADPSGSKNSLQAIGSSISYLQRYSGKAILGVAAGHIDDDGFTGGDTADAYQQGKKKSEQHRSQSQPQKQPVKEQPARKPDPKYTKPFIDCLAHFKEGEHTADMLDKYWEEQCEKLVEQLHPSDKQFIDNAYADKLLSLEEAMKK